MADLLSAQVSDRICKHMNEDHADSVLLYAQVFGSVPDATAATLLAVDPLGMNLTAQRGEESMPVRVNFDHTLVDSEDAHQTLIAMVKQARQAKSA
jgi:putative heme iron utilization protein